MASIMEMSFQPQAQQIIQDTFKSQISTLTSSIITGVLVGLQSKVDFLVKENSELKERVKQLETTVSSLETTIENAELYSRRNCLRISGVPENTEGTTDDYICSLAPTIDVDLKLEHIDRSHRIGKLATTGEGRKPRDIIVKFVSYRKRAQFY